MPNEELTLGHKIGYAIAQVFDVLIWAGVLFMIWQIPVIFFGAPQVWFSAIVLIECVCRLIAEWGNGKLKGG
jgi:hypothetical protein